MKNNPSLTSKKDKTILTPNIFIKAQITPLKKLIEQKLNKFILWSYGTKQIKHGIYDPIIKIEWKEFLQWYSNDEKATSDLRNLNKIYKLTLGLTRQEIRYYNEGENTFIIQHLYNEMSYRQGIMKIKINENFYKYLHNNKNYFLNNLKDVAKIEHKITLPLTDLIKTWDYKTSKDPTWTFIQLKQLLGLTPKSTWNYFLAKHLKPTIAELKKQDTTLSYKTTLKERNESQIKDQYITFYYKTNT